MLQSGMESEITRFELIQPGEDAREPLTFDDFYTTHRVEIARTLALTVGDLDLAYDATDEAMTRAYHRWDEISLYENPQGWVFRTGLNWARSWLRRRRRGREKTQLLVPPDTKHDTTINLDLVTSLRQLSNDHRDVVVLRFYADWTIKQIGDSLEIAEGTVKSRLSRALNALAIELTDKETDQ